MSFPLLFSLNKFSFIFLVCNIQPYSSLPETRCGKQISTFVLEAITQGTTTYTSHQFLFLSSYFIPLHLLSLFFHFSIDCHSCPCLLTANTTTNNLKTGKRSLNKLCYKIDTKWMSKWISKNILHIHTEKQHADQQGASTEPWTEFGVNWHFHVKMTTYQTIRFSLTSS